MKFPVFMAINANVVLVSIEKANETIYKYAKIIMVTIFKFFDSD